MSFLWETSLIDVSILETPNIKYDFRNMVWYWKVYQPLGELPYKWEQAGKLHDTPQGIILSGLMEKVFVCGKKVQEAYTEYLLLEAE